MDLVLFMVWYSRAFFFLTVFFFSPLSGSVHDNLHVSQSSGGEPGFAAGKVVDPFSLEFSVKTHMGNRIDIFDKPPAPFAQGEDIVEPDTLHLIDGEG